MNPVLRPWRLLGNGSAVEGAAAEQALRSTRSSRDARRAVVAMTVVATSCIVGPPAYYRAFPRPALVLPPPGRIVVLPEGGGRINVLDEGEGPAVVLVHGSPGNAYEWRLVADRLRSAGYRVIRYDRKGYGHSDARGAEEAADFDANARELLALLDELDLRDATAVGSSFGGAVVIRAGLMDPSRIARVALLSSTGPLASEDPPPAAVRLLLEGPVRAWLDRVPPATIALTRAAAYVGCGGGWAPEWLIRDSVANMSRPGAYRTLLREGPPRSHAALRLGSLPRPALIIHASGDSLLSFAVAEDLYRSAGPGSELMPVQSRSHLLHITHPELVARKLVTFIERSGPEDEQDACAARP